LKTYDSTTSDALADVLHRAGYAPFRAAGSILRSMPGARAAIWDGGQLCEFEERELSRLCAELAADRTPVVALLDFPRRDRVNRALEIGVSAVLGKPWTNAGLLATIEALTARPSLPIAA
jgi:DNA-binding response OmpR family regulator